MICSIWYALWFHLRKPIFSYSFNLLVVHFCQTRDPPILPVIQKDAPEINLHTSLKALPMLIKTLPQVSILICVSSLYSNFHIFLVESGKYRNSFGTTLWFFQILRWLWLQSSDIRSIGKSRKREWFKPSEGESWQFKRQKYSNWRAIWWNQYGASCLSNCKFRKNKIHISSHWKNSCTVPRKWIRFGLKFSMGQPG